MVLIALRGADTSAVEIAGSLASDAPAFIGALTRVRTRTWTPSG